MKRKLILTLALTLGCSGVAYAGYEPVRTMLAPTLHSIDLKHNHGAVDSAVEDALSKTTDGSLEADDTNVKSTSKAVHDTTSSQKTKTSAASKAEPQKSSTMKTASQTQSNTEAQSTPKTSATHSNTKSVPVAQSTSVKLNVPAKLQGPELYNGCEVTSLSMLLSAAGHPVDKMTLADQITKDPTPATYDSNHNITAWGDPNRGFVGDVTGGNPGYGVYHGPVTQLLNRILPGRAKDLTGSSFSQVLSSVASGHPVIAWTTATFTPTSSWTTWQGPNGPVKATFDEHVVLITGYDATHLYLNDPLDGTAAKAVDRQSFLATWQQLGNQAVTYSG